MMNSAKRRFIRKMVVQANGCVTWDAAIFPRGYGAFQVSSYVTRRAHRWWWEQHYGPIDPPELTVEHKCKNKACCRLEHLELLTRGENARRGNQNTETCKAGLHAWTEDNIIRRPSRANTSGECKACALDKRRVREGREHLRV